MALTALVGRCMFAFVFLASAVNKLQTMIDGGESAASALEMVAPRLDAAKALFASRTGVDLALLLPLNNAHLLAAATFLEGVGAVLLVFDVALGAKMLMLFVMIITPVMHPFWTHEDQSSTAFSVDMIMFYKNVALCGGALLYIAMKPPVVALSSSAGRKKGGGGGGGGRGGLKRE